MGMGTALSLRSTQFLSRIRNKAPSRSFAFKLEMASNLFGQLSEYINDTDWY